MKAKKLFLLAAILIAGVTESFSQIRLTALGGYTCQDKVYGYSGDFIIKGSAHYGGVLSFQKSQNIRIDLTYSYQPTTFNIKSYALSSFSGDIKGSVSYIMAGVTHSPDFTAKVSPYGGIMLGTAIFTPSEKYSEQWVFAVGGKLGAIVHVNERFGIVLQTQLMVPVQGVGVGVGCGSGGCGGGVSTSSSATQLGFTGGVEVKLGN